MPHPSIRDGAYCLAVAALGSVLVVAGGGLAGDGAPGGQLPALIRGDWPSTMAHAERLWGTAIAGLGVAVLAWWVVAFLAAIAGTMLQLRGKEAGAWRATRLSPAFMRRIAAAVLGANVVLAPAAQASAVAPALAPDPARDTAVSLSVATPYWSGDGTVAPAHKTIGPQALRDGGAHASDGPDPGWRAERPAAAMDPVFGTADRRNASSEVVVRRGDTLWAIAAGALGAGATTAEIASEWPRWYQANQAVIGDDPDHLHAGIVLQRPRG